MKIERRGKLVVLLADEGRAIRKVGDSDPSAATEVWLGSSDAPENWEDCDKYIPGGEPTVEDKDAALRRFGVEV